MPKSIATEDFTAAQLIETLSFAAGAALAQLDPSGLNKGILVPDPGDPAKMALVMLTEDNHTEVIGGTEYEEFINKYFYADEIEDFELFDVLELDHELFDSEPTLDEGSRLQ